MSDNDYTTQNIASELNSILCMSPAKGEHTDRIVKGVMTAYPVKGTDKRVRETAKTAARRAVSVSS